MSDASFKFGRQDMLEYREYIDQLSDEEKKFVKDFYLEYYAQDGYYKDPEERIIQSKELQSEANRNHQMLKTEVLEINRSNPGLLSYISRENEPYLSEENDVVWEDLYKVSIELAFNEIMYQTLTDIENENIDKELTLTRFYFKMKKLGRLIRRDKRLNKKEKGKK